MKLIHEIEAGWLRVVTRTIIELTSKHSDERFYAAGFWHFYLDYTVLGCPCFGMCTERQAQENGPDGFRWCPPNWSGSLKVYESEMNSLYGQLSSHLKGSSHDIWDHCQEAHCEAIARVCRRITHEANARVGVFSELDLPEDFVVGIFEEWQGGEVYRYWLHRSIASERIEKLGCDIQA